MKVSRSHFLKHMAHSALEVLPAFVPILNKIPESEPASPWVEIGVLSDFEPGTAVPVQQGTHMLVAHEQGLYAIEQDLYLNGKTSPRRPLRLQAQGKLELNTQMTWPDKACLSILTGNRITEEELNP